MQLLILLIFTISALHPHPKFSLPRLLTSPDSGQYKDKYVPNFQEVTGNIEAGGSTMKTSQSFGSIIFYYFWDCVFLSG
jgi:hypothetical protein